MTFRIHTALASMAAAAVLSAPHAAAEPAAGLRRILRARTSSQLARVLAEDQRITRARLICDGELRARRVPEACFEALNLTKVHRDFAWRESPDENKDGKWLEELCISRAEASQDWRELQKALRSRRLPSRCRAAVLKRRDDLAYADQSERPAEVFARQLPERE